MSVEHPRCAQCRNPIRGRQTFIRLASAGMSFHDDCWVELHAVVQDNYRSEYAEVGVPALLKPYHRDQLAAWLPALQADDPADVAVVEAEPELEPEPEPEPQPEPVPMPTGAIALGAVVEWAHEEPVLEEPVVDEDDVDEPVADEDDVEEPVTDEVLVEEPVTDELVVEEPVVDEPLVEEPVRVARAAEATEVTVVRTRQTKPSRGDRARAFAGKARGIRQSGSEHTSAAS